MPDVIDLWPRISLSYVENIFGFVFFQLRNVSSFSTLLSSIASSEMSYRGESL